MALNNTVTAVLPYRFIARPPCPITYQDYNVRRFDLSGMTMITIYHNPRCSKSRETLSLVEAFGTRNQVPVEVVDYLKTPPTFEQLSSLLRTLGCGVHEMVRTNEEQFGALKLENAGEEDMLRAVATHPKLLQRPIVAYKGRAVIGRPPERVLELLGSE